jgi:hypothetical protein
LALAARVTVTLYVLVGVPQPGVTTIDSTVAPPSVSAFDEDADPDVTASPSNDSVAAASVLVAVSDPDVTPLPTLAVYVNCAPENTGAKAPPLNDRADSVATALQARVTDTT